MATLKHNGARFAGGNYRSRPPKLAVITREQRGRKSGAGKEMALFWVLESLRDNTTNQSRRPLRFENSCFHPDIWRKMMTLYFDPPPCRVEIEFAGENDEVLRVLLPLLPVSALSRFRIRVTLNHNRWLVYGYGRRIIRSWNWRLMARTSPDPGSCPGRLFFLSFFHIAYTISNDSSFFIPSYFSPLLFPVGRPANPVDKLPVLVFLHGESFDWGSSHLYDGSVLSSYTNTVVVTLNFRLGVLGTSSFILSYCSNM